MICGGLVMYQVSVPTLSDKSGTNFASQKGWKAWCQPGWSNRTIDRPTLYFKVFLATVLHTPKLCHIVLEDYSRFRKGVLALVICFIPKTVDWLMTFVDSDDIVKYRLHIFTVRWYLTIIYWSSFFRSTILWEIRPQYDMNKIWDLIRCINRGPCFAFHSAFPMKSAVTHQQQWSGGHK